MASNPSALAEAQLIKFKNSKTDVRLGFERMNGASNSMASFRYALKDAVVWQSSAPNKLNKTGPEPTSLSSITSWTHFKAESCNQRGSIDSTVPLSNCSFSRGKMPSSSSNPLSKSYLAFDSGKTINRQKFAQSLDTPIENPATKNKSPTQIAKELQKVLTKVNLPFDAGKPDYQKTMGGDPSVFTFKARGSSERTCAALQAAAQATTNVKLGGSLGWTRQNGQFSVDSPMSAHHTDARKEFGEQQFLTRSHHMHQHASRGITKSRIKHKKKSGKKADPIINDPEQKRIVKVDTGAASKAALEAAKTSLCLGYDSQTYNTTNPMSYNYKTSTAVVHGSRAIQQKLPETTNGEISISSGRVNLQDHAAKKTNVVLGYERRDFATSSRELNAKIHDLGRNAAARNARKSSCHSRLY